MAASDEPTRTRSARVNLDRLLNEAQLETKLLGFYRRCAHLLIEHGGTHAEIENCGPAAGF